MKRGLLLCLAAPLLVLGGAYGLDHVFPEGVDIAVNREFSHTDALVGDTLMVILQLSNSEPESLKGFYYSEQIPPAFAVSSTTVWIDQVESSTLLHETEWNGSVYPKCTPHRWVIDLPQDETVNNGVGPNSGSVRIACSLVCTEPGVYIFPNYNWAGVVETTPPRETFGYGELKVVIVRSEGMLCGDVNGDGGVTIADSVYLVTYVYREGYPCLGQGDVNNDGRVTVADALYLSSYIYGGGGGPCEK